MKDAIKINPTDSDNAARKRHEEIEDRLEQLGKDQVETMLKTGGLPTEWGPIIRSWLAGDKLERKA
jgi:hypothetical protein